MQSINQWKSIKQTIKAQAKQSNNQSTINQSKHIRHNHSNQSNTHLYSHTHWRKNNNNLQFCSRHTNTEEALKWPKFTCDLPLHRTAPPTLQHQCTAPIINCCWRNCNMHLSSAQDHWDCTIWELPMLKMHKGLTKEPSNCTNVPDILSQAHSVVLPNVPDDR